MNNTISADSGQAFQAIKDQVDLVKLIERDEPISNGFGAHSSKHTSKNKRCLNVDAEKQVWICRSCHAGGSIFDWVMDRDNCDFKEAVNWICNEYSLPHPILDSESWQRQQAVREEKDLVGPIIKQAMQFYHDQLEDLHKVHLRGRGIEQETIDSLLLGYAPSNGRLLKFLRQKYSYPDDLLLKTGLFYRDKDSNRLSDRYRDRYIFPYWLGERIVFSIGRALNDQGTAKYVKHLTHSEKYPFVSKAAVQNVIYGIDSLEQANELIITEGIVDAILGIQAGYSVLSPVTNKFKNSEIDDLIKLAEPASTVYLVNDNEENQAGLKGALATAEALHNHRNQPEQVRLVTLPRGIGQDKVDLADFLQRGGDLGPLLQLAPNYMEFRVDQVRGLSGTEQQKALKELARLVARLPVYDREPISQAIVDDSNGPRLMSKRPWNTLLKDTEKKVKQEQAQQRLEEVQRTSTPEGALRYQITLARLNEDKRKDFEVKRQVTSLILEDMKSSGQLHYTEEGQYYWFNRTNNKLYVIAKEDEELQGIVNRRYDINSSEREYEFLMADLMAETQENGQKTEVHRLSYFHPEKGLYIYNHNNGIYFLDGHGVQLVPNGTDGILFLGKKTDQTFTYLEKTANGAVDELLINGVNFDEDGSLLSIAEQREVFGVWLKSLFFGNTQKTKPIQAFIGEKGSGKSYNQKRVGMFLFGSQFSVDTLERNREDAFIAAISNNAYCAFDNADSPIAWLPDRLAVVASGGAITLRKYYTENQEVKYQPQCFLSINARTPHFKRDDVMDRLLPFKLKRYTSYVSENVMTPELMKRRDQVWSDMINQLNPIVNYLLHHDDQELSFNFRMADFANFGWKMQRSMFPEDEERKQAIGDYWLEILTKLDQAQTDELLKDHPIFMCLEYMMEDEDMHGRGLTALQLYERLLPISEEHSVGLFYKSVRSFGRQLSQIVTNLQHYYRVSDSEKYNNNKLYRFWPKQEADLEGKNDADDF